jgi:hypothetical protein
MLADPLLAYTAYGVAVSYVVRGNTAVDVPMIRLPHDVRYLPSFDFEMTPYGTEWTTEHNVLVAGRLTRVSVRVGDTGSARAWGVGALATGILQHERLTTQLRGELWRQPPLDAPPTSGALAAGGLAAAPRMWCLAGHDARRGGSVCTWRAATSRPGSCEANACGRARLFGRG